MQTLRSSIVARTLCECGCGQEVPLRRFGRSGILAGTPCRFVRWHHNRIIRKPTRYRVDASTGCWVWLLSQNNGYGQVRSNGRPRGAHVVFYEAAKGAVPKGMELDHLCRNTLCVNPDHLEPVTSRENTRRGAVAKLTSADVLEIRRLRPACDAKTLAERFGVVPRTIYQVASRERWADV